MPLILLLTPDLCHFFGSRGLIVDLRRRLVRRVLTGLMITFQIQVRQTAAFLSGWKSDVQRDTHARHAGLPRLGGGAATGIRFDR